MVNNFGAANLQWVGVGMETTPGTPLAAPAIFVPVDTPVWTHPTETFDDDGLRGSMVASFGQVKGQRYDQVNFKTKVYLDSAYFFIRGALGLPDVVTGSSAPYTHKTSVQSGNQGQANSSTVFWADSFGQTMQMAGAQVSELKITYKTGALAELDVTYVGMPAIAITAPANTPTTAIPEPSYNTTITVGGTSFTRFSEIDIDIKRNTVPIFTLMGSQSPYAIFQGKAEVTGTLHAVYQGSTDVLLQDEITNTLPTVVVTIAPVGDAVHTFTVQMSKVGFTKSDPAGTDKWMEIQSDFKAHGNTTDPAGGGNESQIQATLVNTTSTPI